MTRSTLNHTLFASPFFLALLLPTQGQAADDGLIDGSRFTLTARNFYFRQDYRHGDYATNPHNGERQNVHAEWGQGFIADFRSGYSAGTVGVGVDALGLLGLKLDGGNGHVGNGVGVPGIVARSGSDFDGEPKDEYSKLGAALKVRLFDTELRYGDVRPTSPVLYASDIRLLPQTLHGLMFDNRSLPGLHLQGGRMTSSSDRSASARDGELGTVYAGRFKQAGYVQYVGGDYAYDEHLSFKLHTSELENIWTQSFFRVDYRHAIDDDLSFNTGFNYYRTRDSGQALAGRIDNDSWSTHVGLNRGAHGVTLAYTRIDGDTPFDYVWNTYDIELDSASQISDFNNPNERSWLARYDLDFAAFGVPGLSLVARYVRGSDIDGSKAGPAYAYFNGIQDGKHWERDLWLTYTVQDGPAKDFSVSLLQASQRVGGGHTAESNMDELRVILQYPLRLL